MGFEPEGGVLSPALLQAIQKWLDARRAKTEERGVYGNTSSDEVCGATQQMSVFQQPAEEAWQRQ
jgi:hypothetical protein